MSKGDTPRTHELKVWPEFWPELRDGSKRFEIRKNDRGFEVGDELVLRKYFPLTGFYADDDPLRVRISYVTDFEQKPGYVVLGIEPIRPQPVGGPAHASKGDTPRTDANEWNAGSVSAPEYVVDSDVVKQLEYDIGEARAEIERLQKALAFWLPSVPAEDTPRHNRIADDAYLLYGYEGPIEQDAEQLGWICLRPQPADGLAGEEVVVWQSRRKHKDGWSEWKQAENDADVTYIRRLASTDPDYCEVRALIPRPAVSGQAVAWRKVLELAADLISNECCDHSPEPCAANNERCYADFIYAALASPTVPQDGGGPNDHGHEGWERNCPQCNPLLDPTYEPNMDVPATRPADSQQGGGAPAQAATAPSPAAGGDERRLLLADYCDEAADDMRIAGYDSVATVLDQAGTALREQARARHADEWEERAKFKKWWVSLPRVDYRNSDIAWESWQARATLPRSKEGGK